MSMTYSEMRTEVLGRVGDERTDLTTNIATYLNRVQSKLAKQGHRWRDLEAFDKTTVDTSDGGETITPPSDMLTWYQLTVEDGTSTYNPRYVAPQEFRSMYPDPTADSNLEGYPQHYTYVGGVFYLGPVPDAAYDVHIHYLQRPTDMSADDDTPSITDSEPALMALATAMCFEKINQYEDAQYWKGEHLREMAELIEREAARPAWTPSGRGRGFGAAQPNELTYTSPWKWRN